MKIKDPRYTEAGFTLLELVLAVFIFSIIMVTIGAGMFAIQQTWRKVSEKSIMLGDFLNIERVFDSSVRNAIPFNWTDTNLNKRLVFLGLKDSLILSYRHRIIDTHQGGIRFIHFCLKNDKLMAEYRRLPILPWTANTDSLQFLYSEVLAENVQSISFLYADRHDNNIVWLDEWDNSERQNHIPLAIQITVDWKNGTTERWLRRTAGSGLYESYGKIGSY